MLFALVPMDGKGMSSQLQAMMAGPSVMPEAQMLGAGPEMFNCMDCASPSLLLCSSHGFVHKLCALARSEGWCGATINTHCDFWFIHLSVVPLSARRHDAVHLYFGGAGMRLRASGIRRESESDQRQDLKYLVQRTF